MLKFREAPDPPSDFPHLVLLAFRQDHWIITKTNGAFILDARKGGIVTCAPVEKSGQGVLDFECGHEIGQRLAGVAPTFAKALVPLNPEDDGDRMPNGVSWAPRPDL